MSILLQNFKIQPTPNTDVDTSHSSKTDTSLVSAKAGESAPSFRESMQQYSNQAKQRSDGAYASDPSPVAEAETTNETEGLLADNNPQSLDPTSPLDSTLGGGHADKVKATGTTPDVEVTLLAPGAITATNTAVGEPDVNLRPFVGAEPSMMRPSLSEADGLVKTRTMPVAKAVDSAEPALQFVGVGNLKNPILDGDMPHSLRTALTDPDALGFGRTLAELSRYEALPPKAEAAGLTQLSSTVAGSTALPTAEARLSLPVNVSFGHSQWGAQVAERAVLLTAQNVQTAQLQLDPPELGPLNVRIQINQDQVSVHFASANPSVRDALDQTFVRLRELLQEQGLDLVDSGVSDQPQRDDSEHKRGSDLVGAQAQGEGAEQGQTTLMVNPNPGIDYFV